jgi:ABC-type multidrug transport system fused ATPase/permease subunit
MSTIQLDTIADAGEFLAIDRYMKNIFKKVESHYKYVNCALKISFFSAHIIEKLGKLSSCIKDIKSITRLPLGFSIIFDIKSTINLLNGLFENARHSDTESFSHNIFYLFATILDIISDTQAITNALTQLKIVMVSIAASVTSVLYPLTLITIVLSLLIKIRDFIFLKKMIKADDAVMSEFANDTEGLQKSIDVYLKKRLTLTENEIEKIVNSVKNRAEIVQESVIEEKKANLKAQKEAKFKRVVGSLAFSKLQELNNENASIEDKKSILSKIQKCYNHEQSNKIRAIARGLIVLVGLIALSQGFLAIPGAVLLIITAVMSFNELIRNKKFTKELESA